MQKYVIALYIRLSLEDYKYDSMSIENQHLVLNEFVSSMPESTDAEVLEFIDNGYSGTNFERPKVQELIELVRANQIDCIIVKDFSRFGRNSIETGYFIERVFPLFHTRFISINDDFDSDQHKGDTGGMDVAFKYLISEYYSRDMSMKTKSAKYAKMQRGEYQSKVCPYGYRKSADGRMEPNPETAAVVQLIFQLAATGIGAAAVTRELFKRGIPTPGEYKAAHGQQYHDVSRSRGRWSSSTVLRILEDERYIGSYVIGRRAVIEVGGTRSRRKDRDKWFIIPDHHPAIVDKELFEKVQKIRKKRKKESDKINNGFKFVDTDNNLYSGLLYCGRCGTPMYKRKGNTGTRKRPDSYLCKKYSNEGAIKDIRPDYGCKPHRIRIEYLDKIVNAYIDNLVSNPEFKNFVMDNVKAISTNKATLEKELNKSKQTLEKLEKQFKQVYEDKLNDLIPEFIYKDKKQELEKKIQYEKEKLQEAEGKFNTLNKLEDKEDLIFKAIDDIKKNGLTKEELSRLFDKIVVFDKNEITKEEKDLYTLNDMMYNELYENGGLAFHLKFMYPQTITNRRL